MKWMAGALVLAVSSVAMADAWVCEGHQRTYLLNLGKVNEGDSEITLCAKGRDACSAPIGLQEDTDEETGVRKFMGLDYSGKLAVDIWVEFTEQTDAEGKTSRWLTVERDGTSLDHQIDCFER